MSDIFISYARSTQAQAKQIGDALVTLGYSIWRDDQLPAHRAYSDVIESQLNAAKAVVVVWSRDAAASEWVRSEADRARHARKLVQVSVDGAPLPMPFDQIQCVNLVGWQGNTQTPGWQTVASSIAILAGKAGDESTEAAAQAPTAELVLAVLPFDNLSTDPEMQFFSDGVSEEIIARLSRGANLKVVGRTSSFQFRGGRKAEAAHTLGCSHVLDGSIRRAAAKIRMTAHLVDASSNATMWSERYDRSLEDLFAVQDDISENIATALNQAFSSFSTPGVDAAAYDLYLQATPSSYAPDELRTRIALLELATERAPEFAEAWARLAYLRAWLRFYQPFAERAASAARIEHEAQRALAVDSQNMDALVARYFVVAPFGSFLEADARLGRVRQAPDMGEAKKYVGWALRTFGHVRESVVADEHAYQLNPLDTMCANLAALGKMAAGRVEEAVPIFEDLVERVPQMSFPLSSLMRAKAFLEDWTGVDELLKLASQRQLREFEEGLAFIRSKREPTAENLAGWRSDLERRVAQSGHVDVSRLVYAAHLGLVDEAYGAAQAARLGPSGTQDDIMGPDGYRTSLMFQAGMPELRSDPRFAGLCARLGLVEYWMTTDKWPDCADEVPYDFKAACAHARTTRGETFEF